MNGFKGFQYWQGMTPTSKAERYVDYLSSTGVKDYSGTEGNRGVLVLRRSSPHNTTEFLLISLWDSIEAIKRFAGPDIDKAVYYPEDNEFLLTKEPHVTHYEVEPNSLLQRDSRLGTPS
jgi:heme-degrading monooxygenase HmoA